MFVLIYVVLYSHSVPWEKRKTYFIVATVSSCALSLKRHTHGALPRKDSDKFPVKCVGVGENSIQKKLIKETVLFWSHTVTSLS